MDDNSPAVYASLIQNKNSARKRPPARLAGMALLVALGGACPFGYNLLITNPAQEAFLQFVNESHYLKTSEILDRQELESIWGTIISLFFWGGTGGAIFIREVAQRFGRKSGLQFSHFLQVVACALSITSFFRVDHYIYAISRFLLGFAISLSLGIAPMFITECSPKSCRGVTSMATGVVLQISLVIGAVAAMPRLLGSSSNWWILYAGELVLALIVMMIMPFLHESPGHLHSLGKSLASSRSLTFYHNVNEEIIGKTMKELEEESKSGGKTMGLISIWKEPESRRGMLVGAIVMTAMTMSGIAAINAFAFEILLSTGFNVMQAALGNIMICIMSVIGIMFSSAIIDRCGRRPLLLVTYSFLAVINCAIFGFMLGFEKTRSPVLGYCLVGTICLFNLSFAAGPGPVSLFITSELVGQKARGAACTWVNIVMGVSRSLLLASFLPIKNYIGQPFAYFLLFFPPMVVAVVLLFFYLPESKGKSASEVNETIRNLPKLRKRKEDLPLVIKGEY